MASADGIGRSEGASAPPPLTVGATPWRALGVALTAILGLGLFWWHALFVAIAIGLAYLFNPLRLCSLVLYHCAADRFPMLGTHAVGADYAIGGTLFTLAAAFLFWGSRPRSQVA